MKYLESYGAVWKLSDRAYRRFVTDVAGGKGWDLNDYGKMITGNVINVTDFDQHAAQEQLAYERQRREQLGG